MIIVISGCIPVFIKKAARGACSASSKPIDEPVDEPADEFPPACFIPYAAEEGQKSACNRNPRQKAARQEQEKDVDLLRGSWRHICLLIFIFQFPNAGFVPIGDTTVRKHQAFDLKEDLKIAAAKAKT